MLFQFYPLRFSFLTHDRVYFPPSKSSNILRGAFGAIFRRIACVPPCTGSRHCEWAATCPYARMFEPQALGSGPSGLRDWPRPFVFRATHLDGCTVSSGAPFYFDLHLFDLNSPAIAYLVLAFAQLAREGLGPTRGRVELTAVHCQQAQIYHGQLLQQPSEPFAIDLTAQPEPIAHLRIRFVTPTELKSGHQVAAQPKFGIFMARIRDRISSLRALYGPGPLDLDFRAFGERATSIHMTRCAIRHVDIERRSSRTGQTHSIGGFIGEAEYEGNLTEFVPYLRAAQWTGVGRQTVWGKGEIVVETG